MIKGTIWDVDGTILDSMCIWEDAAARFLRTCKRTAEPKLAEIMFRMSLDEGADYLKERYRLDLSHEEILDGVLATIRSFYEEEAPLKPGAGQFLRELKALGIPMIIATSSNKAHIAAAMKRLGLEDCFVDIITCEEVGAGKTKPDIYLSCAKRLHMEPSEICVFEDVIHAVRSANSAGFLTVGVYDAASAADNVSMRKECGIYLHDLLDFENFRDRVKLG